MKPVNYSQEAPQASQCWLVRMGCCHHLVVPRDQTAQRAQDDHGWNVLGTNPWDSGSVNSLSCTDLGGSVVMHSKHSPFLTSKHICKVLLLGVLLPQISEAAFQGWPLPRSLQVPGFSWGSEQCSHSCCLGRVSWFSPALWMSAMICFARLPV